MNYKPLSYLAVALLVIGCQTSSSQTGGAQMASPPCNAAVCQVNVDVQGSPPRITVDIDSLVIARGNQGTGANGVMIHWRLRNNDYEFKNDSIQYYEASYGQQFDLLQGSGPQFQCRDKNTAAGRWGYQIKVYDKATGASILLDPTIVNDGP